MPVYPGTESPIIKQETSLEKDGFIEKTIHMSSHTGTHIDSPAHIIKAGKSLDSFDVKYFAGRGAVLNFCEINGSIININDLLPFEEIIASVEFLLINIGWSRFWGKKQYFINYPVLSIKSVEWITTNFKLKGLGIDAISVDRENSSIFPVHRTILKKEIIVIENLANLEQLGTATFLFSCFPLKIENADGSPIRAVAFLD
jgi:kynurenine formamidase